MTGPGLMDLSSLPGMTSLNIDEHCIWILCIPFRVHSDSHVSVTRLSMHPVWLP